MVEFVDNNFNFSQDLAEWSKKYIVELKDKEINETVFRKQKQKANKEEYEAEKSRLRATLRNEFITNEEYQIDLESINKQYSINSGGEDNNIDWFSKMNEIVDLTLCTKEILEKGTIKAKRNILSKLGSNLVWDDKKLFIYNDKAINKLVDGIKGIRAKYPEFEPRNYVTNKDSNEKTELLNPVFSTMLRG
ncbi:hypothetical protein KJ671_00830 [Patescibacteria group bacterium]|nr:hypothetical protein [Patescibacteria group bacterium]